jgi:prevent-host-death family protein
MHLIQIDDPLVDWLHCSPMATEIPQRMLRNDTAALLRRVEGGERLRITVHGHAVADLVPVERAAAFVPFDELARELNGLLLADDRLDAELRALDDAPRDAFE